jgi:large-conductance mechanosensitive channel
LITGLALFLLVKAYDTYRARKKAAGEEPEAVTEDVELLREIRDLLAARQS